MTAPLIAFPVFVRARDSGEVFRFSSLGAVEHALEPIDVENAEYEAWDSQAVPLSLGVQAGQWLRLWVTHPEPRPEQLRNALLGFARSCGLDVVADGGANADFNGMFDLVVARRGRHSLCGWLASRLSKRWRN